MPSYQTQRKSNASLLAYAQAIDANASAVDSGTGQVTTTSTWTENQKELWTAYWNGSDSFEAVSV